ncbi:Uncharacterized protein conserved in cyanobacteria [Mycobacterium tuberculosis]|nr:Uncharacterized protein conserved in cyanobacteria [Mycobacterium tuberculosis]
MALVVEVVSPSTKRKDRRIQPALYAEAQIRHYWRVETDPTAPAFARVACGGAGIGAQVLVVGADTGHVRPVTWRR